MRKIGFSLVALLVVFSLVVPGITLAKTNNDISNSSTKARSGQTKFTEPKLVNDPVKYVNPLIGTDHGHGRVAPMVGVPFGMTTWTPATSPPDSRCTSPYYHSDKKIQGIRGSHWPNGSCTQEYGSLTIMPMTDQLKVDPFERASSYSHDKEISDPGYYSVKLSDYNVRAEVTGTKRTGFLQFTFPETDKSYIVVDSDAAYEHTTDQTKGNGYVKVLPDKNEIVGYDPVYRMYQGSGKRAGFKGYFVIKFKKPFEKYGTWNHGDKPEYGNKKAEDRPGAFVKFTTKKGETVDAKIGTSFVSIEDAQENLKSENADWDFDKVKDQAEHSWNKALGKIKVSGGSQEQKTNFYTALYHAMLLPRLFSDENGSYPGFADDDKIYKTDRDHYMDYSIWDTFRAQFPLLEITHPNKAQDMVQSLVTMGEQGGWLPIFPMWDHYTSEMIGDHTASVISDAYAKGLKDFDVKSAYKYMKKNATQTPKDDADYKDGKGRRALDSYLKYGYIPLDDPVKHAYHGNEQVSRTLEYAYDDFTLAEFAKRLGKEDDYQQFIKRAYNYKNVFDPSTGFVRGKYADGSWVDSFDPLKGQSYITESTPWIYTWAVPQDVRGVSNLLGGRKEAQKVLNKTFEESSKSNFSSPYYDQGNEPSHQMPYLFDFIGAPWLTQKWVREIMNKEYHPTPDGLPGDEDAGQMSAWYIFGAMGFYPVTPGTPNYEIGSPIFDKITIQTGSGHEFTIETKNNSDRNRYIQSAKMNGKEWNKPWFTHNQMAKGGKLVLQMGSTPNKSWGSEKKSAPPSLTKQDPGFKDSNFELSSREVDANEPVKATVKIQNTGGIGTKKVKLKVDDKTIESKNVVLNKGESKHVTFTTRLYKGGKHQLTVDDLDSKTVNVHAKPAQLNYSHLQVTSPGDSPDKITAKATVKNVGSYKEEKKVPLYVDDQKIQTKSVELGPGESKTVSFSYTFDKKDDTTAHWVRIGDTQAQKVVSTTKPMLNMHFEGSGKMVKDSSLNGFDGSLHGDAKRATGKFGKALQLNGKEWAEIPDADVLNGGNGLTVAAWVKLKDADDNQKIIAKSSTHDGYILGVQDGKFYPEVWDDSGHHYSFSEGSIPANQWVHLALTRNAGGRLIGYVNGKKVIDEKTSDSPIKNSDSSLFIGTASWSPGRFAVNGLIDEARVFHYALNSQQIQNLYHNNAITGAPEIHTKMNGKPLEKEAFVGDSKMVRFTWDAEGKDNEVERVSATFDGKPYKEDTSIDVAGKPGKHELVVTAVDKTGSLKKKTYVIHVTTSISDMKKLVKRYVKEGEIKDHKTANALNLQLITIGLFAKKDDMDKVEKHLKGFEVLFDHQKKQQLISEEVYNTFKADTDDLIEKVSFTKPALNLHFEGMGDVIKDSSANGFDGSLHGDARRVSGKFGKALKLNGKEWVEVPDADVLNGGKGLTVTAWVKLKDTNPDQKIIAKSTTQDGYILGVKDGKLDPEVWDTAGHHYRYYSQDSIPANQWVHLALTRKAGGRLIGYVNGKKVIDEETSSSPIKSSDSSLFIGSASWHPGRFSVNGLIDEVRVFQHALSSKQIQDLYQNNSITNPVLSESTRK